MVQMRVLVGEVKCSAGINQLLPIDAFGIEIYNVVAYHNNYTHVSSNLL